MRPAKVFVALATVVLLSAVVSGIVLSPLALQLLGRTSVDWILLSNIGQSYGAISAVLSAFAFLGVAIALILQARQVRESRTYSIRELHSNLLQMAMHDVRFLEVWGDFSVPPGVDRDVAVYTNLVINYFVTLYETNTASIAEVDYHAEMIFRGAVGRAYWKELRGFWLRFAEGKAKQVVLVLDDAYQRSVESGPPSRSLPTSALAPTGTVPVDAQPAPRGRFDIFRMFRDLSK